MRAVAIAEDRRLAPTELEERPLQPYEARVEVAFCGICGSDIHFRASSQLVLMIKEAQFRASFAYRGEEFHDAVDLLATGKVRGDRLITGTSPLEAAQSMFERLEDPATDDVKILLTPMIGRSGG